MKPKDNKSVSLSGMSFEYVKTKLVDDKIEILTELILRLDEKVDTLIKIIKPKC